MANKYKILLTDQVIMAYPLFMQTNYKEDEYILIEAEEPVNPDPVVNTIISKLQAMERFTDPELEQIYTIAKTNVTVEIWLEKFKAAQFIDLADPKFQQGIQNLETAGLIDPGRAAEILAP